MLLYLPLVLTLAYTGLLLAYWFAWRAQPETPMPPVDWQPGLSITVIVPARNEASHIAQCLESLLACDYPAHLLEIVVVDDHSSDNTAGLVQGISKQAPQVKCLFSGEGVFGKKQAIEAAVAVAGGVLIVTTDADCLAPEGWLRTLSFVFSGAYSSEGFQPSDHCAERQVRALTAPVLFHPVKNFLQHFQALDFIGLMGTTAAGLRLGLHRMGNGANLAYPKTLFEKAGGYAGALDRASGDDMYLLNKIDRAYPGSIFFLKSRAATVLTEAPSTWPAFFQQRLRWGTKNAGLPDPGLKAALALVFLFCWSIIAVTFCWLVAGSNNWPEAGLLGYVLATQLAAKAFCDFLFLRSLCRFFQREKWMRWFLPCFFAHILYIAGIGTASLFLKKYQWKGRRVS